MSLALMFYGGDPDAIIAALQDPDINPYAPSFAPGGVADFCLHLEPRDLDRLSGVLGLGDDGPPQSLRQHLRMLRDTPDGGCCLVERAWVDYVARNAHRHDDLFVADHWFKAMAKAHNHPLAVTPEAVKAVGDLRALCQKAISDDIAVVHAWWR